MLVQPMADIPMDVPAPWTSQSNPSMACVAVAKLQETTKLARKEILATVRVAVETNAQVVLGVAAQKSRHALVKRCEAVGPFKRGDRTVQDRDRNQLWKRHLQNRAGGRDRFLESRGNRGAGHFLALQRLAGGKSGWDRKGCKKDQRSGINTVHGAARECRRKNAWGEMVACLLERPLPRWSWRIRARRSDRSQRRSLQDLNGQLRGLGGELRALGEG